jgi:sulfite reductase (NADPH) hemoprotein beta-component
MYKENITDKQILEEIDELVGRWANEREDGEGFGDFTIRAGIVQEVIISKRDLHA